MRLNRTTAIVITAAGSAAGVTAAHAQVINWAAPVDGLWSSPASWVGGAVPSSVQTPRLGLTGPYTATISGVRSHAGLIIDNPDATVLLTPSTTVVLGAGGLVSTGSLVISDSTSSVGAVLLIADTGSLSGTIRMANPAGARLVQTLIDSESSFAPGSLVVGTGLIQGSVFNAEGEIVADTDSRGIILLLDLLAQSPSARLAAINGGRLDIVNIPTSNDSFDRVISGGSLFIDGTSALGGEPIFQGVAMDFEPGAVIDGHPTATDCAFSGDATIDAGASLTLNPGNSFAGTITLIGGFSDTATLILADDAAIACTVVLDPAATGDGPVIRTPEFNGTSATLRTNGLITGGGRIEGNTLENRGDIVANGQTLDIGTLDLLQGPNGRIGAINGGELSITNRISGGNLQIDATSTLAGTPNLVGVDSVFMPGSTIVQGALIDGGAVTGTIATVEGAVIVVQNNATLTAAITLGQRTSGPPAVLDLGPGIVLDGPVTLNGAATGNATLLASAPPGSFAMVAPGTPISGTGQIRGRFLSMPAQITPGRTEMGTATAGEIEILFDQSAPLTPDALVVIDLLGDTSHDRLITDPNTILGGQLAARPANGFVPGLGQTFEVVAGEYSGRFDSVAYSGPIPAGLTPRLFYGADTVHFGVVCKGDFVLPTGTPDIFDILGFLEIWSNETTDADYDGSGTIDIFDIIAFLVDWNAGCP